MQPVQTAMLLRRYTVARDHPIFRFRHPTVTPSSIPPRPENAKRLLSTPLCFLLDFTSVRCPSSQLPRLREDPRAGNAMRLKGRHDADNIVESRASICACLILAPGFVKMFRSGQEIAWRLYRHVL
nr:hypothetical protein CFP56_34800 [Quercus suber]